MKRREVELVFRPHFKSFLKMAENTKEEDVTHILLDELWAKVFRYFDFKTAQETFCLVSQRWMNIVRNDSKLSQGIKIGPGL